MSDGCIVIVPGGPPRDVCESSASTSTTLPFTQPAVGADVAVNVGATDWISSGQVLFVEGGGYYTAVPSTATEVRLTNLGYTGNAAPGAVINPPQLVSPGGLQGPAVTYQITYKPGGAAVPGQVYTTDATMRAAVASLLATGGNVEVFLDGSSNGGVVPFTVAAVMPTLGRVKFTCVEFQTGSYTRLSVTTAAGVQFSGSVSITGGQWTCDTSTAPTFISGGVEPYNITLDNQCYIDASSAANAAISYAGVNYGFISLNSSYLGAFGTQPAINLATSNSVDFFIGKEGGFGLSNSIAASAATTKIIYQDPSASAVPQTTFTGGGGTITATWPTATWASSWTYPVNACVNYLGTVYQAITAGTNKNPATQPTYWKPISRQRYSNATADLWYQLTGAGPYANGGTAGVEAMTSSAGVVENQAGPFGTAPVIPTGERIRTATSTKNPAAAAATVWAWCRPGVVSAEALLWGKLVDASDVTASIRIGFTAAGLPTASIRRTGQPADDTATAGAEHTLGAGSMVLIAATYDGANLRLYVNGELAATTAAAGTLANTALSSWIAGATLGGLTPFVGKLDEVGMDNTVYPQATLAKMAAAGLAWLS